MYVLCTVQIPLTYSASLLCMCSALCRRPCQIVPADYVYALHCADPPGKQYQLTMYVLCTVYIIISRWNNQWTCEGRGWQVNSEVFQDQLSSTYSMTGLAHGNHNIIYRLKHQYTQDTEINPPQFRQSICNLFDLHSGFAYQPQARATV